MRGAPLWFRAVEKWTDRRRRSDIRGQRIHDDATATHATLLCSWSCSSLCKLAFRRNSVKPKGALDNGNFCAYIARHDSETIRSLAGPYGHVAD